MTDLTGKVAIITGASRGIGAAAAKEFAAQGAFVFLTARSRDDLQSVTKAIRDNGGTAEFLASDMSRYFGVETAINSTKGIKEFKLLAQELIDEKNPGTHNQAVMEFGAKMCKPQNPNCVICPLKNSCFSLENNKIKELPFKEKKLRIRNRFFNYLVIVCENGSTKIEQRTSGIWKNMYQFPLIESEEEIGVEALINNEKFEQLFKNTKTRISLFNEKSIVHKLSHQHIFTKFWIVKISNKEEFNDDWNTVLKKPVPKLIADFLTVFNFN